MSTDKIIRYASAELRCTKCKKKDNDLQGVMVAHDKGHYVHYEDYKLMENLCKKLMKQHSDISCENIRLRKAGDAMYAVIYGFNWLAFNKDITNTLKEWLAAKEGKPSV